MNEPRLRSLQELKTLKRRLDEAARERRAQQAALASREAAARRERELFATTVGPVTPLAPVARALLGRTPPEPVPLQRLRDEAAVLREALSDDFDVESLLDTDESLSWRRVGIGPDVVKKLRRGGWAIQAQLDLHGLRRDEARERLAGFLRDTARQGSALRAHRPRQGQRLAWQAGGAQGQGARLAGAKGRGAGLCAGARGRRRSRCAGGAARLADKRLGGLRVWRLGRAFNPAAGADVAAGTAGGTRARGHCRCLDAACGGDDRCRRQAAPTATAGAPRLDEGPDT